MSQLTGTEPHWWHKTAADGTVTHNMTDPRTYDMPAIHWSMDERAYLEHLLAHEAAAEAPTPRDDDHDVVRAVLAYVLNEEQRIAALRELALAARTELGTGVPAEQSQAIAALRAVYDHADTLKAEVNRP